MNEHLEGEDRAVLTLLSTGMTDAEIAERLSTTPAAVAGQVSALLDRLGLDKRADLILAAALGRL